MADTGQTPRGWYDVGGGFAGFWNGTQWTGERISHEQLRAMTAPRPPVPPPPPAPAYRGPVPPHGRPSPPGGRSSWLSGRVLIGAGSVFLILVIVAAVVAPREDSETASSSSEPASRATPDSRPTTTLSPESQALQSALSELSDPTEPPATTEPPAKTVPTIQAGTYVVGTEFAPGVYRVERYWATLDANQEILQNELVTDGFGLAVVPDSAAFVELSGAAMLVENLPVIDPISSGYKGGTYLVGADIPPGQYRVTGDGRPAYGARLSKTLEIIDNDLNDGSVILTLKETDFAFTYTGTLERIQ